MLYNQRQFRQRHHRHNLCLFIDKLWNHVRALLFGDGRHDVRRSIPLWQLLLCAYCTLIGIVIITYGFNILSITYGFYGTDPIQPIHSLMTEEQRIEYLLGPWSDQQFAREYQEFNNIFSEFDIKIKNQVLLSIDGQVLQDALHSANPRIYLHPFEKMLQRIDATNTAPHCHDRAQQHEVILDPGDQRSLSVSIPNFAKTRGIGGGAILVQCMEYGRHWDRPCHKLDKEDREWEDKQAVAVWRGTTTGTQDIDLNPRVSFVRQYIKHNPINDFIDVGFHHLCQGWDTRTDVNAKQWIKKRMSMSELLSHKYVISIEGNDVASNVKWVIGSNSVPFMPAPTAESWGLEGTLIAGFHFIELSKDEETGWNLEEQIQFCMDHDDECKQIALNGKRFMEHYRFCDREYQQELEAKVVDRYCEQVSIHFNHLRREDSDSADKK